MVVCAFFSLIPWFLLFYLSLVGCHPFCGFSFNIVIIKRECARAATKETTCWWIIILYTDADLLLLSVAHHLHIWVKSSEHSKWGPCNAICISALISGQIEFVSLVFLAVVAVCWMAGRCEVLDITQHNSVYWPLYET